MTIEFLSYRVWLNWGRETKLINIVTLFDIILIEMSNSL